MSVKFNKKVGKYVVEFQQSGKRVHETMFEGVTKEQAKKWEHDQRAKIYKQVKLGFREEHTIVEGVMRYLKEFKGKSRHATESHATSLNPFIMKENKVGKPTARLLSELPKVVEEIHGVYEAGELTGSTLNRRLAILRTVANKAFKKWKDGETTWITTPIHVEMLPENKARQVYLTKSEVAALLRKIKNREYRRFCLIAAMTGLRRGEIVALEPHNIRGNEIWLWESDAMSIKNSSPRNIPIRRQTRFAFKRLPFQIDPDAPGKAVHEASGGKVRLHDLRHTFASLLINRGKKLEVVGKLLGHKSLVTTNRYSHLDTGSLTDAVDSI